MVTRADILKYVEETYEVKSEHLWASFPSYEVMRHRMNRKWFALIADVPKKKIGLAGDEYIDILDIKCEPDMVAVLSAQKGFSPAYHMNKKHWITVILDGGVADDEVYHLLDLSYELTK